MLSTSYTLPEDLQVKVDNFSQFQKTYCEFRARGLSQSLSAQKAGSKAADKASLGRVGYQIEQMDGAKEYIDWIRTQRASLSDIDQLEIIDKLRKVYDQALMNNKLTDANKAAELLGSMIGLFVKGGGVAKKETEATGPNLQAFKEDEEEGTNETADRISQLQKMLKDINQT